MIDEVDLRTTQAAAGTTPSESAWYEHGAEHGFEVVGEGLSVDERLVLSPVEGSLRDRGAAVGEYVCAGDIVAKVAGVDGQLVPVHSPFAGWVMGFLLPHGSPVRKKEPVLWLRSL
jgi:biotin carboxyl carrier protein